LPEPLHVFVCPTWLPTLLVPSQVPVAIGPQMKNVTFPVGAGGLRLQ
jgi:hypothetical protein